MNRLRFYFSRMDKDDVTFDAMYSADVAIPAPGKVKPVHSRDNTFWRNDIAYTLEPTHRLAQDVAVVTVAIPADMLGIISDEKHLKGLLSLKRLHYYFTQMQSDTANYTYKDVQGRQRSLYDGEVCILPPGPEHPARYEYDPTFWLDDFGASMTLEKTHKLALDLPTVKLAIPAEHVGAEVFTPAAADYCLRAFKPFIDDLNKPLYNRSRPKSEKGWYHLYSPGGEVLTRNAAYWKLHRQKEYVNGAGNAIYYDENAEPKPDVMCLHLMLQIQLPYNKLRRAEEMLTRELPRAVEKYLAFFDIFKLYEALELERKQNEIRAFLRSSDYCAFVANGSVLPREKGTDLPMSGALPFTSTPEDEIEVCGVRGMGIRRGVTVITGGGYSGKSTLLDAISSGVYNHASGDGRELCVTDDTAVKIAAEDGRSVKNADISPFIKWIPGGDPADFSTEHASGSTSQAANIMEAVGYGAKLLLIDEDKSATNFMIRDALMKRLIEKEPITPFTDRVRELGAIGVSTILVIGGSGEYLSVTDRVYMMDDFVIRDATGASKNLAAERGIGQNGAPQKARWNRARLLRSERFSPFPEGATSEKLEVSDMGFIFIADERIDTRGLLNVITPAQLTALGFLLRRMELAEPEREFDAAETARTLYAELQRDGLDAAYTSYFTTCERFMDMPRMCELLAVVNRMRNVTFVQPRA